MIAAATVVYAKTIAPFADKLNVSGSLKCPEPQRKPAPSRRTISMHNADV